MDFVVFVLAILYLCIRSTGLGIALAISFLVYFVWGVIDKLKEKL